MIAALVAPPCYASPRSRSAPAAADAGPLGSERDPDEGRRSACRTAKTVHLEATVDGTVSLDLTGTGQAGDIALTGTKLTADIDIEDSNREASLAVPAILGLTADVVVVGDDTYTRTSMTGDKYQKSSTSGSGSRSTPPTRSRASRTSRSGSSSPRSDRRSSTTPRAAPSRATRSRST